MSSNLKLLIALSFVSIVTASIVKSRGDDAGGLISGVLNTPLTGTVMDGHGNSGMVTIYPGQRITIRLD